MNRRTGFTLIELLVTIAIVGILAAIALPMFGEQMAKGRRSQAMGTLTDLQLRQERWRASHGTYATMDELTGSAAATTAFNAAQDNYDFSVSGNTGTDALLTATPKNAQAGDRCGNFLLRIDNDNNSAPAGQLDKTTGTGATRCWN
jgi:prepilin-type N-terminal cleavage/methylation domain